MTKITLKQGKPAPSHCAICKKYATKRLTKDHIIPVSFGGKGGKNIRHVCKRCNCARSNHITVEDWQTMNEKQRNLFWKWVEHRVQTRLKDEGYPLLRKTLDKVLLHIMSQKDFSKTRPLLFIFKVW
jgi:hypothetical protein